MSKTVKDLTAGTAGGIAQVRQSIACIQHTDNRQVLVGQPFDIVKVVSHFHMLRHSPLLMLFPRGCKPPPRGHTQACLIVQVAS